MVTLGMVSTGAEVLAVSDRDRILQAMADCCAEAGYRETTVEAVLERAGVAPESFESQFASKEDCALAALHKIVSETLTRISMASSNANEVVAQRKFEGEAILELVMARPAFTHLAMIEARQGGTGRLHDSYESAARMLALMLGRTGDAGWRPSTAARGALGGIEAIVRRELAAGRTEQVSRLLPNFVYAALVPFVGQGEALRQARLAAAMAVEEG
jgi:AcrR family transcriptional regulator